MKVAVEAFGGEVLDYHLLPGKWKLVYTTASDVVSLYLHACPGPARAPLHACRRSQSFRQ